ncbi:uncharacterized protein LOC131616174 isoform X1 [Vicia villosa]|uniref:uncharacterized protein LOC131616174 isoform X1 n=1 Tax=Vicia villosa TaxID=3911 RepID=UPI00273A76E9|nr:uncharacterized protein LOC131616174 isoform X1 [Vicia villosa]
MLNLWFCAMHTKCSVKCLNGVLLFFCLEIPWLQVRVTVQWFKLRYSNFCGIFVSKIFGILELIVAIIETFKNVVLVVSSGKASTLASLPGDVDGYISICGYGSLLSVRLIGFLRLFSVVGAFFFTHGMANLKTQLKNKKEVKDQIKILLLDM